MGLLGSLGGLIFGGTGGIIGGIADELLDRDDANSAQQMQINEAEKARAFQKEMRQSAYQDTVADLKAANLNPMLAFSNGATSAGSAPMASGFTSKGLTAAQTSAAGAQATATRAGIENINANSDLIKAQTAKTLAEIPQITTSTANIAQQTEQIKTNIKHLEAGIDNLRQQSQLGYHQTLTEVEKRNLMYAQQQLAEIQQKLTHSQITNTEALTQTQRVITNLRQLEIPGAKNVADFEKLMSTGGGGAGQATGTAKGIMDILKNARQLFGDKK